MSSLSELDTLAALHWPAPSNGLQNIFKGDEGLLDLSF